MKCKLLSLLVFFFFFNNLHAQVAGDTSAVEILSGTQKQMFQKLPDGTELQILVGTVHLRQGKTYFNCDSLVLNSVTKVFEAFGHVHINDNDTTQIHSEYLRYLTDKKYAYLQRNVHLTDSHSDVTTNELEYDVSTKTATYKNGGRVVTKKSVLTSREGIYNSFTRDMFFRYNVELKDPGYYLHTDSMIYNSETGLARFITDTYIRDSSKRTIRTKEGSYDLRGGHAQFTKRTTIEDKCLRVTGDAIANDDATGIMQIDGNAVLIDTCQGINILANRIFANKKTESYLATQKPLMIIRQESDSIYVAADTLFSARLSDLVIRLPKTPLKDSTVKDSSTTVIKGQTLAGKDSRKIGHTIKDSTVSVVQNSKPIAKDSINRNLSDTSTTVVKSNKPAPKETPQTVSTITDTTVAVVNNKKSTSKDSSGNNKALKGTVTKGKKQLPKDGIKNDSTNRYFVAYRNVRIFSDSLQAVGDSLFYSFKDSTFRLFKDPVVWSKKNQITGDTIYLYTRNKKADRIQVFFNSLLVNELQKNIYNQVRSNRIDGYFKEGTIDSLRAKGSAESIYFIQDNDSAFSGINQTSSDLLDVYFTKGDLQKVVYRNAVKGTLWPISQRKPGEMRLKGFIWADKRRPKTKYELFQ